MFINDCLLKTTYTSYQISWFALSMNRYMCNEVQNPR